MLKLIFTKWWVILVQGILLIVLSIYIFNHPIETLAGISLWIGIFVSVSGLLGALSWLIADKQERENASLFWNLLTLLVGVIILLNIFAAMKMLTILIGLWMLITGVHLIRAGAENRKNHSFGWIVLVAGILTAFAALMMVFNIGTGATGVSVLFGLQVLVAGIALIIFAFVKKAMAGKVNNGLKTVYSNFSD